MGRPPKHPSLRALHGTTSHASPEVRIDPAAPLTSVPEPPEWLDTIAVAEWRRVAPELLAAGILSAIELTLLAAYCAAWSEYRHAYSEIRTHGRYFKTQNGYKQPSPAIGMMNKSLALALSYAAKLGITTIDRGRCGTKRSATEADPLADLMARRRDRGAA